MRNGKARKEIYFNSQEQIILKEAKELTGLDGTNTLRLLFHIGWRYLKEDPKSLDNTLGARLKIGSKRILHRGHPAN